MRNFLALISLLALIPVAVSAVVFDRDLYFGLRNDADVTKLQKFLQDQGAYSGPVTGNFLSLTREAVKSFQKKEGIAPVSGYFGPLTRVRANAVTAAKSAAPKMEIPQGTKEEQISFLISKITELQGQLEALQKKLREEKTAAIAPAADTTPPAFTKKPVVSQTGFVSKSSLGARYPYRVVLDWAVDETGAVDESVSCTPTLKIPKPAGRATEYYPEPHTSYSCTVTVKDVAGNPVTSDVTFTTPKWVSVSGSATSTFPAIETVSFKLGDFSVYNGSTTPILFANFETLIYDGMDSTPNRNRKVNFILKDGLLTTSSKISTTEFTFLQTHPDVASPQRLPLNLPFAVTLDAGEEKKISLWVEQMLYVKAGIFRMQATKVNTTAGVDITGLFNFTLTKEPDIQ